MNPTCCWNAASHSPQPWSHEDGWMLSLTLAIVNLCRLAHYPSKGFLDTGRLAGHIIFTECDEPREIDRIVVLLAVDARVVFLQWNSVLTYPRSAVCGVVVSPGPVSVTARHTERNRRTVTQIHSTYIPFDPRPINFFNITVIPLYARTWGFLAHF